MQLINLHSCFTMLLGRIIQPWTASCMQEVEQYLNKDQNIDGSRIHKSRNCICTRGLTCDHTEGRRQCRTGENCS